MNLLSAIRRSGSVSPDLVPIPKLKRHMNFYNCFVFLSLSFFVRRIYDVLFLFVYLWGVTHSEQSALPSLEAESSALCCVNRFPLVLFCQLYVFPLFSCLPGFLSSSQLNIVWTHSEIPRCLIQSAVNFNNYIFPLHTYCVSQSRLYSRQCRLRGKSGEGDSMFCTHGW